MRRGLGKVIWQKQRDTPRPRGCHAFRELSWSVCCARLACFCINSFPRRGRSLSRGWWASSASDVSSPGLAGAGGRQLAAGPLLLLVAVGVRRSTKGATVTSYRRFQAAQAPRAAPAQAGPFMVRGHRRANRAPWGANNYFTYIDKAVKRNGRKACRIGGDPTRRAFFRQAPAGLASVGPAPSS